MNLLHKPAAVLYFALPTIWDDSNSQPPVTGPMLPVPAIIDNTGYYYIASD